MKKPNLIRFPWAALAATLATLVVGAVTVVLADFGGPAWVFVLLLLWLGTIGLPTTVAALLVTAGWGPGLGFYGLGPYAGSVLLLGWVFQALVFHLCHRYANIKN